MMIIATILPYIQIILSLVLVVAVLLQQSGAGAGGVLGGGGDTGGLYHTRRGFEKFLFGTTIVVGILFVVSTLIAILVK